MIRIHEIKLNPEEPLASLPEHIKKKLGMKRLIIQSWKPVKESIDAREKPKIKKVYSVDFSVTGAQEEEVIRIGTKRKLKIGVAPDMEYHFIQESFEFEENSAEDPREELENPPVVVGFGPCGMFAALLLAQMGYRPLVLERGKAIGQRVEDVERFWRDGVLDPESNVQFGEGGAGSFSDGKLTTQIKDKRVRKVLTELAEAGGGEELLYRQKPHVGTDVLRGVVKHIREEIVRLGGTVEFQSRVTGLKLERERSRRVCGVEINGQRAVSAKTVVLALGHSARDTFRMLYDSGIELEQKPFSMGARIEHSQRMIDLAQYGEKQGQYDLGAADYKLSFRCQNGRGVYTFCMCPGGRVIASASCEGGVVTNGMSNRSRELENANSALLVDVRTEDFGSDHPLAGIAFQEKYERLAFECGGGAYRAPAQRVGDFLKGVPSDPSGEGDIAPSYEPGVTWTNLEECLPEFVTEAMREALPQMGKRLAGFDRPDAVLTGVESRSSSPVRIVRNENLECRQAEGLFPGGEGAGFAGGITSAAVDGIRIAEEIAKRYKMRK